MTTIDEMNELKEIKEKLYSKNKSLITDEEIHNGYRILTEMINPLKRRYRIFSICENVKILMIFIFLILFNSAMLMLINSFGFYKESTYYLIISIVISCIFWGGLFLLYLYIDEYTNYISNIVGKEILKMREELYRLLRYQIDLMDEGLKRNIFFYKKYFEKTFTNYQKLFDRLDKERLDYFRN